MNSALMSSFEHIEKNYTMAREILETSGTATSLTYSSYCWKVDRLQISGALNSHMLRIDFCDESDIEDLRNWRTVLSVTSLGTIQTITSPSISELDAGESDSEENFIPWQTFLVRAHRELFGEDGNADS
jgi:hypothetical protein